MALTDIAHDLIDNHFKSRINGFLPAKKLAIDATCGNGNDTLFLAKLGFETVIGFDIQALAINNTRQRIAKARMENVILHQTGHENLPQLIQQAIDCIVFNFGYLPSSEKFIRTSIKTSLIALESSLAMLSAGGMISLMCYPGHSQGLEETAGIQQWLANLDSNWSINTVLSESPNNTTPVLYTIQKVQQPLSKL